MSSNAKADAPTTVPPANAWSQPLRPKPNTVQGPPPGMGKGRNQSGPNSVNSTNNQNALRERFIGLSLNMVGQKVVVTQTNGSIFEGIFHTFSPFASLPSNTKNKYVIKACKVIKPPTTEEDTSSSQVVDQSTVIISANKVACLTVKSMRIDSLVSGTNGSSQKKDSEGFRTDTEISGGKSGRPRDLVAAGTAWTTGGGNSRADALMGALEDKDKGSRRKPSAPNTNAGLRGTIGEWDQFRANQELFNVNATFDENLYTTELDKSQIDNKKIAEAERLAREIENTTSTNLHIAEERGHKLEGDYDEEDLYSGVLKDIVKVAVKSKNENQEKTKNDNQKLLPFVPKKMNYAAAAAKADAAKKSGPPGFSSNGSKEEESKETHKEEGARESPKETPDEQVLDHESAGIAPAIKPDEITAESDAKTEALTPPAKEDHVEFKETPNDEKPSSGTAAAAYESNTEEKPAAGIPAKTTSKLTSKLNANAKEFTLNPTAKTFTPGISTAPVAHATDGPFVDPNVAVHLGSVTSHMSSPHYMHGAPMGQPGMEMVHGMMPMMNPQFVAGVRYPSGYGGMDQHMPQMHPQPQHVTLSAPSPGPASVEENISQAQQEGDAATVPASAPLPQQPQLPGQPPPQQQQVPVPYGVPPGPYFPGQMAMHPRGPAAPHPGYHPQFVGGPQQMVGPAGAPYRHLYPMNPGGMVPNVQVRGPGAPYYPGPVGPVPYPPNAYVGHGMVEDDSGFRGGQRGGRGGRSGGRRARGRSGRGGRGYSTYHQHGGRQSGPTQIGPLGPSENWAGADSGDSHTDGGVVPEPPQSGTSGEKSAKQ